MLSEVVGNEIEFHTETVMKKPISKELSDHLIEGFAVFPISDGDYELYVLGQNLQHAVPLVKRPLEEWLVENGY